MLTTKLKIELIQIPIKNNSSFEETTKQYFENLDCIVYYSKNLPKNFQAFHNIKVSNGIPDLYVENNTEYFYVECKKLNDGLRINQIKWIAKHHKEKVLIAIPNKSVQQQNILLNEK